MKAYGRGMRLGKTPVEEKVAGSILAAAVFGTTLLVSPAVGVGLFFLGVGAGSYLIRKNDFNREAKRLEKKGYVALTKTKDGWLVRLTKKGLKRQRQIQIQNLILSPPKVWDGKWRLFIFDIPEKHRYARDAMRNKMKSLGLYNIQRSVLAYPYDCRAELEMVANYYRLNEYASYVETSYIDIDKELRRYFGLKHK